MCCRPGIPERICTQTRRNKTDRRWPCRSPCQTEFVPGNSRARPGTALIPAYRSGAGGRSPAFHWRPARRKNRPNLFAGAHRGYPHHQCSGKQMDIHSRKTLCRNGNRFYPASSFAGACCWSHLRRCGAPGLRCAKNGSQNLWHVDFQDYFPGELKNCGYFADIVARLPRRCLPKPGKAGAARF